jgi:Tfp pilus assembly protein PilX
MVEHAGANVRKAVFMKRLFHASLENSRSFKTAEAMMQEAETYSLKRFIHKPAKITYASMNQLKGVMCRN